MNSIYLISSLATGAVGAWGISRHAHRIGLLDRPCERSSHHDVTPKGGGVGILMVLIGVSLILTVPAWLWVPVSILSLVSFLGDRLHLSQILRLIIQFVCAAIIAVQVVRLNASLAAEPVLVTGAIIGFYCVFIAGTANFYNFMDGINGIAGMTGVVGFCLLGVYCKMVAPDLYPVYGRLAFAVALATLGFLPFNVPHARVFMGDVGSILLGTLFAALAVIITRRPLDMLCLSSFLFPFYADELCTMGRRLLDKENLLNPHRRHLYQILANQLGYAHWQVSLCYVALQIIAASAALSLRGLGFGAVSMVLTLMFALFFAVSRYVRRWEGA
jgi:Fuc2NAc and GlcNAc transferase